MRRAFALRPLVTALFVVILLAGVLLLTSMDKCLKEAAFARTAKLRVYQGNCCNPCVEGEANYLGNGKWLTLASLLGDGSGRICIDGHEASIFQMGVPWSSDADQAILETAYRPFCPVTCRELDPTPLRFGGLCCGEDLYWSNEFKCNTVNKCEKLSERNDGDVFFVTTAANYGNAGAGIFDLCGNLVGMVRCAYKDCGCHQGCDICGKDCGCGHPDLCGCGHQDYDVCDGYDVCNCDGCPPDWRTECVALQEGWFAGLDLGGS